MRPKQSRIFPAGRFVRRMNQETMHLGAIRALEFRFLDPTELNLRKESIVPFRQVTQLVVLGRENFKRPIGRARAYDDVAVAAHVVGRDFAAASDHGDWRVAGDSASVCKVRRDAHQCFGTVVLQDNKNRFPIGRPVRLDHVAVEICGQNLRLSTGRRNDRERMGRVFDLFWITSMNEGDRFAIRTPGRRRFPNQDAHRPPGSS